MRTDVETVNRYSPQARGVIVMRLNEGDRVVGIAVFRPGLAEAARRSTTMTAPDGEWPGRTRGPAVGGTVVSAASAAGGLRRVYADQFQIYTGNANPDLAAKICRYLGSELGDAEVFEFANENIFVQDPGQRPREGRLHRPAHEQPGQQVDHGAADHDRRLQAGVAPGGSRPSCRTTPTAGRTRRTSRASRSRPASSPT